MKSFIRMYSYIIIVDERVFLFAELLIDVHKCYRLYIKCMYITRAYVLEVGIYIYRTCERKVSV